VPICAYHAAAVSLYVTHYNMVPRPRGPENDASSGTGHY
jgi:hypothetical protein